MLPGQWQYNARYIAFQSLRNPERVIGTIKIFKSALRFLAITLTEKPSCRKSCSRAAPWAGVNVSLLGSRNGSSGYPSAVCTIIVEGEPLSIVVGITDNNSDENNVNATMLYPILNFVFLCVSIRIFIHNKI